MRLVNIYFHVLIMRIILKSLHFAQGYSNYNQTVYDLQNMAICGELAVSENPMAASFCIDGVPRSDLCTGDLSLIGAVYCESGIITAVKFSAYGFKGTLATSLGFLSSLTMLKMSANNIHGSIPSSYENLVNLKYIDFSANVLTGTFPTFLSRLKHLSYLDITGNSISGRLPSLFGEKLTNIQELYLFSNRFSGTIPSTIGYAKNLISLKLFGNSFTGTIPTTLAMLKNITNIWLNINCLTGTIPSSFGILTNLNYIYLNSNKLNGTIPLTLGKLTKLIDIKLYKNKLTGTIPSELGSLQYLHDINFNSNSLIGTIPYTIGYLTNINYMIFSNNQLLGMIPTSIVYLTAMIYLNLQKNSLTGTIPSVIGIMTNLLQLYLGNNHLTGTIPSMTDGGKLVIFSVPYNSLSRSMPQSLYKLSSLQFFILNNNQLTGGIQSAFFDSWPSLFSFQVQHNKLSGGFPFAVESSNSISSIRFDNNKMSGAIPGFLSSLVSLDSLQLQSNKFSGTIPQFLASPYLTLLDISDNKLSGTVPSGLCGNSISLLRVEDNNDLVCYSSCLSSVSFLDYGRLSTCTETSTICDLVASTNIGQIYSNWSCSPSGIPSTTICGGYWTGIECSASYSISALRLSALSLQGTLPSSLGDLLSLSVLNISGNNLSGSIPLTVSQLSSLVSADFSSNSLRGIIPSGFGLLNSLTLLDLSANQLVGTVPSINGKLLLWLLLSNNKLSGSIPSSLCDTYLRKLSFGGMDSLGCYATCLSTIPSNSYGNILDCDTAAAFCDILAATTTSSNVESTLSGWRCNQSLPQSSICSGKWSGIQCEVNENEGGLVNVVSINLTASTLTGTIPSTLGNIISLTSLIMSNNQLHGNIPNKLGEMTLLKCLDLTNNLLTSYLPSTLCQLKSLHNLLLSSNQFIGSLPSCVSQLSLLNSLRLSHNKLTSTLPSILNRLNVLTDLYLSWNYFTGMISSSFVGSSLTSLDLSSNRLTGTVSASLCQLDSLVNLYVDNNSAISCYDSSCTSDLVSFHYGALKACVTSHTSNNKLSSTYMIVISILSTGACIVLVAAFFFFLRRRKEVDQGSNIINVSLGIRVLDRTADANGCSLYRGTLFLKDVIDTIEVEVIISFNEKELKQEYNTMKYLHEVNKNLFVKTYGMVNHTQLSLSLGGDSIGMFGIVIEPTHYSAQDNYLNNPHDEYSLRQNQQANLANCLLEIVVLLHMEGLYSGNISISDLKFYGNNQYKLVYTFGILKIDHTTTASILASISFLKHPPELLLQPLPADFNQQQQAIFAMIIWNLGLLLYEHITGNSLYYNLSVNSITDATAILQEHIDNTLYTHCPDPQNWLHRKLLQAILKINPTERPQVITDKIFSEKRYFEAVGETTLHLFISQDDVPVQVINKLLDKHPNDIMVLDTNNLLPVQYALGIPSDPSVIDLLLRRYPESRKERFPDSNMSLIHYAIDKNVNSSYLDVLLPYFLPYDDEERPTSSDDHAFGWTKTLQHDVYASCIERVVTMHSAHIQLFAYSKDELGRVALHIAAPKCKKEIEKVLYFLGIYSFSKGVAHQSSSCTIRIAVDTRDDSRVALKIMKHKDQYEREISVRAKGNLSEEFVLRFLTALDGGLYPKYHEELMRKGYADCPYCLVMPRADRTLHDIIYHELIFNNSFEKLRTIMLQLLQAVRHLHSRGFIHGDIKPLNVMRTGDRIVLIDLDAAVSFKDGQYVGVKYSSAFIPPEMVYIEESHGLESIALVRSYQCNELLEPIMEDLPYTLLHAQPSYDLWSLGVTLFQVCTGKHIFPDSNNEDNIDVDDLIQLSRWSDSYRSNRLQHVTSSLAKNLLSQLLNKQPLKRPSADRALAHPFFTGKKATRMPGEDPEFDLFISYRVAADAAHAERLYQMLRTREVKVWWDKVCLEDGKPWEEGFCNGLAKSRAFVPLLSREAINSVSAISKQNFEHLHEDSPCDNVLLEYRLALELREMGLIEFIYPVMIGDNIGGVYTNYFGSGCHPQAKEVTVTKVEDKVKEHLDRQGLGAPLHSSTTASGVLAELVKCQGGFVEGQDATALDSVVDKITDMITKHHSDTKTGALMKFKSTAQSIINYKKLIGEKKSSEIPDVDKLREEIENLKLENKSLALEKDLLLKSKT